MLRFHALQVAASLLAAACLTHAAGAQRPSPDRALRLGDSSLVVLQADPALDLAPDGARTFAVWLRSAPRPFHTKIFSRRRRAPAPDLARQLDRGFDVFVNQYSGTLGVLVEPGPHQGAGRWTQVGMIGLTPINDGRWHHVALVQDRLTLTAYVDGHPDFRFTIPPDGTPRTPEVPLKLGWDSIAVVHFVGEMDDVTVWSRALAAGEVRRLMYDPPDRRAPGLAAWWRFDDDTARVAHDAGPRGRHGRLIRADVVPSTRPTAPPFRETWAYRALLGLAALAALYALMRLYALRLERQKRRLERLVVERTRDLERANAETARALATVAAQAGRLQELDEAKSRFFANVSHEFRTPLTLILGPLEGLLAGRYGALGPAVQGQHELMRRNARRLLRLVNQILDLAKLEASDLRLDRRPGDLVAFVREATLAFAPLAERRAVRLAFRSEVDALVSLFDAEQLEKVLLNLLSNALKFTEADGTVEVTVRARGGAAPMAEVAVRDTGIGIPAEALPRLFDRFYQVEAGSTRRHEGTGIGLALAHELVELHGGEIHVASAPGAGSTFTVTLPLADVGTAVPGTPIATPVASLSPPPATRGASRDAAADAPSGAPSDAALPIDAEPWREALPAAPRMVAGDDGAAADEGGRGDAADRTTVLVVDDNPDVRTYLRSVLEPGYRVLEAADGAEGLAAARAALPDLVVADVMMPGLDGLALAAALREGASTEVIPVILLTARATDADQVAGLRAGADVYLAKPFAPDVLEAQVAGLLAQRRRLRARLMAEGAAASAAARDGSAAVPDGPADGRATTLHASPFADALRAAFAPHLADAEFNPDALATAAGLSYAQLYRRLREEHDVSPSRFLRTVRVEHAVGLLQDGAGSVTEVAYAVGFNSLSYFHRAFRERYGVAPSEWVAAGR